MFRDISIFAFAAVLLFIAAHSVVFQCGFKPIRFLCLRIAELWDLLLGAAPNWIMGIRVLAFWVGLFSFFVLLLTGFVPLLLGGRLEGVWLMLHATLAPVFADGIFGMGPRGLGMLTAGMGARHRLTTKHRTNVPPRLRKAADRGSSRNVPREGT